MKINGFFLMLIGVLGCWSGGTTRAQAAEVLYDGIGFLQGTQSFEDSLNLPSAGQLTVTLSNVAWPQQLASLNMLVSSAQGALGPEMATGTQTFNVSAGNVYAQWFGTAQGPLNTGVYALEIQFQPTGGTTTVPLPTSIALLVSGLGLLIWQRRVRASATDNRGSQGNLQAST